MDSTEQHNMLPVDKKRRRQLPPGIFLLPSIMTGAKLPCGYYASIAALMGGREDFDHAAKAIGIPILFDSLDGRIARMTGTNTEFGVQFDSLADVVSFGTLAPAIVAYAWGYRSLVAANGDTFLGHFAWLCCLCVSIFLRMAAGALQCEGHGAWRQQELCRHADARRRGCCGRNRPRLPLARPHLRPALGLRLVRASPRSLAP